MLVSLFSSSRIHQEFDITFAYCYTELYKKGLHSRLKLEIREKPLRLPTINSLFDVIGKVKNRFIRGFLRAVITYSLLQYGFFFYDILRLFFVFRRIKPDILHINNGGYPGAYSCIAALFAARIARINKIVFVVNNTVTPYDNFTRYIDKPIDWFVAENTSVFITGSKYARDKLSGLWNMPEEKIINIPNTIMARPIIEPKELVLRRLGITNNHVILGNIALLERRKGQRYLIEALEIVKRKFNGFENIILIIEGTGGEEEYLKKLVADLNLTGNILFIKNEKNIFDLMNILDIFVVSSIEYEDFPNVILEAMSLGKPVIGTRVAGIPEQIDDGMNGFIVKPADAEELSLAMLTLIQDNNRRIEMGVKSKERFNRFFSYDKTIDAYLNLYNAMKG